MDVKETVRKLVKEAVEAHMQKQTSNKEIKPAITVLLTYSSSKKHEILKAIAEIEESFQVTVVASKEWASALDNKEILLLKNATNEDLQQLWSNTDLLIFPVASFQLVTKLALMIDDDKELTTAIQFQLLGKPIIIANDEVELGVYQQVLAPYSLQEKLQRNIRTIQSEKVKWVSLEQVAKVAKEEHEQFQERQPLILAKHIEKASRERRNEIIVPENSKITPVAKDMARALQVHIKKNSKHTP
ncbi:hypothetical protein [Sutcliffiella rhizosphaerae]|uniref:Flavoprotein n=1 Tax=Sutcliffiella rhizosphaerae TaxID=2880967 RepID=A0ABM8YJL8_9BACI|nr:hypothetical protein [Sutcliffiella rhizosphaerae]CAG9619993.1 hypothetical protein BACCIP111883_00761 [Sutcliffiella rhizosphaerae]